MVGLLIIKLTSFHVPYILERERNPWLHVHPVGWCEMEEPSPSGLVKADQRILSSYGLCIQRKWKRERTKTWKVSSYDLWSLVSIGRRSDELLREVNRKFYEHPMAFNFYSLFNKGSYLITNWLVKFAVTFVLERLPGCSFFPNSLWFLHMDFYSI